MLVISKSRSPLLTFTHTDAGAGKHGSTSNVPRTGNEAGINCVPVPKHLERPWLVVFTSYRGVYHTDILQVAGVGVEVEFELIE